jgi:N6-adenosine-specific RNA methylase IME4
VIPETPLTFPTPDTIGTFNTILVDPPWRWKNRTGKGAPEHRRLYRYATMPETDLAALPVGALANTPSHLYLWCPDALMPQACGVMSAWGFTYKALVIWYKIRRDGGPDRRCMGFYFRNVTEVLLLGVKGKLRTLDPGRRQPNIVLSRKRRHSEKPDEMYPIIEACSPGPFLELFARTARPGWMAWGDEVQPEL